MRFSKSKAYFAAWVVGGLFTVGLLSGCSGSDGDDENLNSDKNDSQGDLGNDDAHEGNGTETADGADKAGGDGAGVNSDTGAAGGGTDGVFNNAGQPPANPAPADTPANAGGANGTPAVTDNSATPPPANAAAPAPAAPAAPAAAPAAAAAAAAGPNAAKDGGRVRYVKEGGAQVVNAPNGSPVMTLDQGEHPITWEENGWLKIADGMYLPVDGMSTKGVPRARNPLSWSH